MRSLPALLAVLLTAGALAGPAQAGQGTGLYAPFPSPSGGARAERFVGQLGVRATRAQLAQGVGVATATGSRPGTASGRAGIGVAVPRGLLVALLGAGALVVTLLVAVGLQREDLVTETTN